MKIVLDSWKSCQKKKGLEIYVWCIMPSHVHMIIGSNKNKLEDIVRDMKSFISATLKTSHVSPMLAQASACAIDKGNSLHLQSKI